MNLYKEAMLLRYYKYDLKDARKKMKIDRFKYFILFNAANFLYSQTKDIPLFLLTCYFSTELINSFTELEVYSSEFIELKNLYNDLICEYNKKINNTLEFNHPIQVSQAFIYAYKNGYLSKDMEYHYNADNRTLIENIKLAGATVVTGNGCCRHLSRLLSDIMNEAGFDSVPLSTRCNHATDTININGRELSRGEFAISLLMPYLEKENVENLDFNEILSPFCDPEIKFEKKWEYDRNKVPINHSITGVLYDGRSYYIDPTNYSYYEKDDRTGKLLDTYNTTENTVGRFPIEERKKRILKKKILSTPSASFDYIEDITSYTDTICRNNIDVFDQFYTENHELYDEITEKLKKINR